MNGETIRYRVRWQQLLWAPGIMLPSVLLAAMSSGPPVASSLFCVVLLAEAAWLSTTGVELRPDALVMRGIRRRVLPWRDITWIGSAPLSWSQCVGVTTRHGRMRRLRAPHHTPFLAPDRDFLAKAHTIHDYWVAHRGPDWQPLHPFEAATSAGSWP